MSFRQNIKALSENALSNIYYEGAAMSTDLNTVEVIENELVIN